MSFRSVYTLGYFNKIKKEKLAVSMYGDIGENVWAKMIEEVDLDGNGVIDFEEFKDMMKKLCS